MDSSAEKERFDAAVALKNQDRHQEAIDLLEASAPPNDLRAGTRAFLGLLYGRVGRTADSIAILETVAEEQPKSYRASFGLFVAFSKLNDAQRLRREALRWMAARGERPAASEKGHALYALYAKLVAAVDDKEVVRIADDADDEELD